VSRLSCGKGREAEDAIGRIVRHVNGTEIQENGRKLGVRSSHDAWKDPDALCRLEAGPLRDRM
jgi:hypothetical protein